MNFNKFAISTDSPHLSRRLTMALLVLMLAAVAIVGYSACVRHNFFWGVDQTNTALVARNLAQGNGYYTDFIWLWIRDWGSPHHPEDIWPLLQPTITAAVYLFFGASIAGFMAIEIMFFMALIASVYYIGNKIYGPWEGFMAALITCTSPSILGLVDIGTNDVGAAFLYLCAIYSIYRSFDEESGSKWTIIAAIFTGLSIHQKFQGVFLVIGYGLWQLGSLRGNFKTVMKRSSIFLIVLILMGLPLIVRNYLAFHQFTFPTSKLLNSLAAAWDPLKERWRQQLVYYNLYWEHELPTYAYLLKHRGAHYLYVERPIYELTRLLKSLATPGGAQKPLTVLAIMGVFTALRDRRKWVLWNLVVTASSACFVLFGHMEPRYYVFIYPLVALFAARFLVWAATSMDRHKRFVAIIFIVMWAIFFASASKSNWRHLVTISPGTAKWEWSMLNMCSWLKSKLNSDEGIVTFRAPQIAFETSRYGACPPTTELKQFILLADRYKLRYLMTDLSDKFFSNMKQPGTQYLMWRQLAPLWAGHEIYGFKMEYQDGDIRVYRIPRPNEVDLDSLPVLPPEPDDFTRLLLPPGNGGITEAPPPLNLDGYSNNATSNPDVSQ